MVTDCSPPLEQDRPGRVVRVLGYALLDSSPDGLKFSGRHRNLLWMTVSPITPLMAVAEGAVALHHCRTADHLAGSHSAFLVPVSSRTQA